MVTSKLPAAICKTGFPKTKLLLSSTVRESAPGPAIARFLSINNSLLVREIVLGVNSANVIVSPEAALAMASRNEPGPLSTLFVTVSVAAKAVTVVKEQESDACEEPFH
jgi:hypothetical protein